ncbi:hypothetical protein BEN30_12320 [Magnetovibrio blakemorei]|uniref:Uncharacterized protein n=2 Tax=Magnetovibrio blakemorei TaxID=28181 RepID=A0A1E5Q618_9PROT|nr:hypothetical protein BEN30_12320 [Magnetovibrio blakemorei]
MAAIRHMEQLGKSEYAIKAMAVNGDGDRAPFTLSIYDGGKEGTNYYCWVRCPYIRDYDLKIINIGKSESLKDSLEFIKNFLKHSNTQLINENEQQVDLPPLDTWNN